MKSFKIISPLYIDLPNTKKKGRVRLNLNIYRNQHYIQEGKTKKAYQKLISKQFPSFRCKKIEIEFTMFKHKYNKNGSIKKTIIDKSNVYSVIIKYLLDALTQYDIIEDDNDFIVKKETINPTQYLNDPKEEERAEIYIKEV